VEDRLAAWLAVHPDAAIDDLDMTGDATMLDDALDARIASGRMRIWRGAQRLVVSPRLARLPRFAVAAEYSAHHGWPVAVRLSGGTTVVHRTGILNVSRVDIAEGRGIDAEQGYRALCTSIVAALAQLDIHADIGTVAGSHCDGRHNIRWNDRKLAGTSAAIRQRNGRTACLTHANIAVMGDVVGDVAAIAAFERWIGLDALYDPDAHTTVEAAHGKSSLKGRGIMATAMVEG
jgi:octanoyl-[GcvH]:protein N-octanoyltransferase